MIGRRGVLGGLIAMAAGWTGGDPGTGRGSNIRGGLPGARPDQQYRPIGPQGPVGSSNNVVKARILITYGTGETGLFQYAGSPGRGNPPEAWSAPPAVTVDPYGNTLPASGGFATQNAVLGQVAQLVAGVLQFTKPNPPAGSLGGAVQGLIGRVAAFSGRASAGDTSVSVGLASAQTSQSGAAQVVIGPGSPQIGGQTKALLEVQGVVALTEQGAAPPTPVGAGVFYSDATGHFVYKGPGGTVTVLAPP